MSDQKRYLCDFLETPIFKPTAELRGWCVRNRLHRRKRGRRLQDQPLQNRSEFRHGRSSSGHQFHSSAFQPRIVQSERSILHRRMGL